MRYIFNVCLFARLKVALRRQQTSQDLKGNTADDAKTQSMEALLVQKRVYQKHLRNLQQSSLARDILHGKLLQLIKILNTHVSLYPVEKPFLSVFPLTEC